MNKEHIVTIADMKIAKDSGILITYALGSCVGVCLYDREIKLGAMLHIMLPENPKDSINHLRYADTGISHTIQKMVNLGADKKRIVGKIAGGAKMFDISDKCIIGNIGLRNVEKTKEILRAEGIVILAEETGEAHARTMYFDVNTGIAKVKTFGREEIRM